MAKFVLNKIDILINYLTMATLIGGGIFLHLLTAMTIKSYYGKMWGYLSFLLPGIAEIYLVSLQISDKMYNYAILLTAFISIIFTLGITCFTKNVLIAKFNKITEN